MEPNVASSALRKEPQQQRSREMVAKIVTAAHQILLTAGPEAVTTNRVAKRTGISKGSIYQYFRTRDDIVVATIRSIVDRELPPIQTLLGQIALDPPEEMISAAIDILIAFTAANAPVIRYLTDHPDLAHEIESSSHMPALMHSMVTLHVQRYRERYHPDLDPETIAWLFINVAISSTQRFIEMDEPIGREQLRVGLKRAISGLLVSGAADTETTTHAKSLGK